MWYATGQRSTQTISTPIAASADDRLTLQRAFFPDGLTWNGNRFGTAVTCLAFRQIEASGSAEDGMASPRGCARVGVPETFVDGDIAA
jgi:hypothetical protein